MYQPVYPLVVRPTTGDGISHLSQCVGLSRDEEA
jgi:hypothetical protein